MRCINIQCNEELESGVDFCPFCGTDQPATTQSRPPTHTILSTMPADGSHGLNKREVSAASPSRILEMRAGDGIWHFAEQERHVSPGEQRPLVIRDEQVVHLAHTDRELQAEELLQRVKTILDAQSVPVDVELVRAKWMNDSKEARPRLVAQLRNHPYSDIKMIMGVDYMGKWASIQLHLGSEVEPIPKPPAQEKQPMNPAPLIVLGIGGFLLFIALLAGASNSGGAAVLFGFLGICALAVGGIWLLADFNQRTNTATQQQLLWQQQQQRQAYEKAVERLVRTFKVDDMRLFCTAMRAVFQVVVDDIVQQGGEVVRVEGGKGGFFDGQVAEPAAMPSPRRADAAASGV